MNPQDLVFRELTTMADYEACVALQRSTWGDDFRELVPPAMLLVTQKVGGVLIGAFDSDRHLVGFVYGITGLDHGQPIHWSHMLAVEPRWRDRGIGQLLKRRQRREVLALGVSTMRWTFDPLVARNAHMNLNRLGAAVIEYVPNLYGDEAMSVMDRVIGTDRFIVEWDLEGASPAERPLPSGQRLATDRLTDTDIVEIEIPEDIQTLKQHDPDAARQWREITRAAFAHYLERGYRVLGLRRPPTGPPWYVLSREDDAVS